MYIFASKNNLNENTLYFGIFNTYEHSKKNELPGVARYYDLVYEFCKKYFKYYYCQD